MLFWIFVAALVVGIVMVIVYINTDVGGWCEYVGVPLLVVSTILVFVSGIVLVDMRLGLDGEIAANNKRYESLVYQYENDLYDNDNDLGRKELMDQIQEWNENLARNKEQQDDFWIGIYIPDIYDQFEFIELDKGE